VGWRSRGGKPDLVDFVGDPWAEEEATDDAVNAGSMLFVSRRLDGVWGIEVGTDGGRIVGGILSTGAGGGNVNGSSPE
jgi:hypothetical protein